LRGEVGAKRRVRGRLDKLGLDETPLHPNPLPARGERERTVRYCAASAACSVG
jgi:hypothetical protein